MAATKTTTDCMRTLSNTNDQLVIRFGDEEEIVIRICKGGNKTTRLLLVGPKSATYQTVPRELPPKIPISLPEI